ncbi:MAG: cobalamin biosynthesis protein CobW [Pseudobacteriovorax sp.]|nr:cobalamin biosynthesis protein CobW [Pseudobacteriovorax sp.]
MEAIIVIVGFLGVGKTTLLQRLAQSYEEANWSPQIIINDYQNAVLDAQRFRSILDSSRIQALSGSCICCSGLTELRAQMNSIPPRDKGITFIEANGTSDAVALAEFLGVGIKDQFSPPVQLSIVDVRYWQRRGQHNELEANQVQVSSLILLNHTETVDQARIDQVKKDLNYLNPSAKIEYMSDFAEFEVPNLAKSDNTPGKMEHLTSHWSSCSVDLPDQVSSAGLSKVLDDLPSGILRVKGCTRLDEDEGYSYFEKIPSGEAIVRPYTGKLVSGPKLLVVGPGSDPAVLQGLVGRHL